MEVAGTLETSAINVTSDCMHETPFLDTHKTVYIALSLLYHSRSSEDKVQIKTLDLIKQYCWGFSVSHSSL